MMRKISAFFFLAMPLLAGMTTASDFAFGAAYKVGPDTYRDVLKGLAPGDHVHLMPGAYKDGLPLHHLNGTPQAPIMLSGPKEEPRAIFLARQGHNTISIINSSYVTVSNLDIDGRNLPVSGVKCEGHADWAHHITLDGLRIRGHGRHQQTVAISTKCPAWGWVIRNNKILGSGTGLYLGDSDGGAPFIAGLIERNLIVDTLGYNLQIKHQQRRNMLPGMPTGPSTTIIRHNVFSKRQPRPKEIARPNVLVGHWPLSGPGADDLYAVYGNFFYENPDESLFQGEGNIALYNNLFVNHFGDAIRIQPHNDIPRDVSIFCNTIMARNTGVVVARGLGSSAYHQWVIANIVFARSPIRGAPQEKNLTGMPDEADNYLVDPFASPGQMNLAARGLKVREEAQKLFDYPDAALDFDGDPHERVRMGAYSIGKSRPRWFPALEMKPFPHESLRLDHGTAPASSMNKDNR
jgi:hypothetical protein